VARNFGSIVGPWLIGTYLLDIERPANDLA